MLVFSFLKITAQSTKSIKGQIFDERGKALPYANILVEKLGIGSVADANGRYHLLGIPTGTHILLVKVLGYKQQRRTIVVDGKNLYNINFSLEEAPQNLKEVVVKGKGQAQRLEESAQAVTVVRTGTVKLQTADLGEVLAKTQGVSVQRSGGLGSPTRFALNGLSGDQIRFFYNGIPLDFSPYVFGIANVPVNAVERIDVYKGVVPIQFGADALGGAVNLVSSEPVERFNGSASYQIGSFNTHRATLSLGFQDGQTGLFATTGGFFDYSDNNYKIDVAVSDPQGQLSQESLERFHDAYRAYGINISLGIKGRKWANELSLEGYYGDYSNEIQNSQAPGLIDLPQFGINNAVAGNPFGELVFTSFSAGANIRYNANLSKNWEIDVKGGYNYNERESFDVTNNLYDWFGEVVRVQNQPGEFGPADNLITKSESIFLRQRTKFELNGKHQLQLSVAPTHAFRTGDDLLIDGPLDPALDEGRLFDFVVGLEHQMELFEEKLQNIAFVKNYSQNVKVTALDPSDGRTTVDKRAVNNFGIGNGLRYNWSERLYTKLSYEYAIRLPRLDEIFGDGQLIQENLGLRPESSHNLNIALNYGSKNYGKSNWSIGANLFLREIDDLIFLLVDQDDFGAFQNVWSANSTGVELSGSITNFLKGLTVSGNLTYQEYRNTSNEGPFVQFRGDRIPNTPYLFANASSDYRFDNIIKEGDDLSLFWSFRFVNAFFVGWESVGQEQFKLEVPNREIQSAGITYRTSVGKIRNAITAEVQNLTNAKVFDRFGLQRPGRAFYVKSTVQF
ncbi:MAG: TonB-dependent receptor [Bacteroidota bacterium]